MSPLGVTTPVRASHGTIVPRQSLPYKSHRPHITNGDAFCLPLAEWSH